MAARKVGTKVFDFAKIASTLPASAQGQFASLRAQYDAVSEKLARTPETPAAIDFASYQKSLVSKNLIAQIAPIKAAYEADLKTPYPEDTTTAEIKAQEKAAVAEVTTIIEASKGRLAKLESELAALKAEKDIADITTDEFLRDKPEERKRIEQEIEKENYA
eukprot:m.331965 g.331965  ORF g.331965 m.331965 type:complete len:162 (-) comp16826_c0_seq1:98-583(-)